VSVISFDFYTQDLMADIYNANAKRLDTGAASSTMVTPAEKIYARMAEAAYMDRATPDIGGYLLDASRSNDRIKVYKKPGEVVFATRGTRVTDVNDLVADVGIFFNRLKMDPTYLSIKAQLKDLIESGMQSDQKIRNRLILVGHSLGGSICVELLTEMPDQIDAVHVFNSGIGYKRFAQNFKDSLKCYFNKDSPECQVYEQVKRKLNVYITGTDPISVLNFATPGNIYFVPATSRNIHSISNFTGGKLGDADITKRTLAPSMDDTLDTEIEAPPSPDDAEGTPVKKRASTGRSSIGSTSSTMSMTEGMTKEDRKKLIQERDQWTTEQRLNNMVKIVEESDVRLQTYLGWIPRTYNGHKGLIREDLMKPIVKAVRASALAEDQARSKYSSGKSNLCSGDSTTPSSERSGRPSEYAKDSIGFTPDSFISAGKKRKRRSDAMTPIPLSYEDEEPVPLPPPTPKSVEQIVADISPLPTRKKKGDGQRAVKALQDYLGQGTKEKAQNEADVVLAARSGRPQRLGRKPPGFLENTDAYEDAYQKIYNEVARRFDPSAYATEQLRQAAFNKQYKAALKEFNDGLKAERAKQRAASKEDREYKAGLKAARAAEMAEKKTEREASLTDKRVPKKKSQRAPRQEGNVLVMYANYNVDNARFELSNLLRTMSLSDAEKAMQKTYGPTFKLNADGTVPESFNGSGFKRKVRRRINGQFY